MCDLNESNNVLVAKTWLSQNFFRPVFIGGLVIGPIYIFEFMFDFTLSKYPVLG